MQTFQQRYYSDDSQTHPNQSITKLIAYILSTKQNKTSSKYNIYSGHKLHQFFKNREKHFENSNTTTDTANFKQLLVGDMVGYSTD